MSWDSKTDYCGLEVANKLEIKSSSMNRSGQYLEKPGASGAIVATKAYGIVDSPSCEYVVKAANSFQAGAIKLGAVTTVESKRYALASFTYSNGADQEPTFSASSVQIETTTDGSTRTFDCPAFSISPDEAAEIIASAAELSGTGCELQKCTLTCSANVKPHTKNGDPVASDVTMGKATVDLEILQTSTTAPTIAAGTGWEVSSPLTCDDPDADFPTWKATLTKKLAYTASGN